MHLFIMKVDSGGILYMENSQTTEIQILRLLYIYVVGYSANIHTNLKIHNILYIYKSYNLYD